MFSIECRQIDLLTPEDIDFTPDGYTLLDGCANIFGFSTAQLTFTEPIYLLHAEVRGYSDHYVTRFSLIYENSFGEIVTYMNVDVFLVS